MPMLDIYTPTFAPWFVNYETVKEVLKELEISLPLAIRSRPMPAYQWGFHRCVKAGDSSKHVIYINILKSVKGANSTLIHELAHAAQAERAAREVGIQAWEFFNEIYAKSNGMLGVEYANNTFEVAARKLEETLGHKELIQE